MSDAEPAPEQREVLWQFGPIVCTSLTRETDSIIEIRLYSGDVLISSQFFTEPQAASQYAIDKLRSYNNAA